MYACMSASILMKIDAVLSSWDCLCMQVCVCVQPDQDWCSIIIMGLSVYAGVCLCSTWSRLMQYYHHGIVCVCRCVSVFNLMKIDAVLSSWDCLCMQVCVCVQPDQDWCSIVIMGLSVYAGVCLCSTWSRLMQYHLYGIYCLCMHVCVCVQPNQDLCSIIFMGLSVYARVCPCSTWSRLMQYYHHGIVCVCMCVCQCSTWSRCIQYYLDGCVSVGKSGLVWTRCQTGVLHHTHGHLVYVGHRQGEFHCYSQWSISLECAAYRF